MSKPEHDSGPARPVSPYLRRPARLLDQALFDTAKERGALALKTWRRVVYVNISESARHLLFFDNFDSMTAAALFAAQPPAKASYIVTLAVMPERVEPYHLVAMGSLLHSRMPHAEPGDA